MNKNRRTYEFKGMEKIIAGVVQQYISGMTPEEIAGKLGKSRTLIGLYLKSAGVKTRKGGKRQYSLNEEYFEKIDDHGKAYWLGFLLADGNVHPEKRSVRIGLQASDSHHLERFLEFVESNSHVRYVTRRTKGVEHEVAGVTLCSAKMARDLIDAGWSDFKKKGDVRIVQAVPDEFKPSLMRGLFDGDGSFMKERATFIDAHLSVVFWFQEQLVRLGNIRRGLITPNPGETSYVVKWSGGERLCAIREFLYSTPGPFLQRKKDRASIFQIKVRTLEETAKQASIQDGKKWCPKCESRKAYELFSKNSRTLDGLYSVCKDCWNAASRKSYHERSF